MIDLEFVFDSNPWESALEEYKPGSRVSAVQFLSLLQDADETDAENALEVLAQKQITLDINSLPKAPVAGQAAQRLKAEEHFIQSGNRLQALEENDPLRLYLEELAQIPATGDIAVLAQQLASGDDSVIQMLVNLMLGKVVSVAGDYVGRGVYLLDLIQEGSLGLWQAIQNYTGTDFETHCIWWVRQFMAGAVVLQARSLGIGQKLRQAAEDYRAVDEKLLTELGRNPTAAEIAEAMHMSAEEINAVAEMVENVQSLRQVHKPEPEQHDEEENQAVEDTAYFQMRQRIEQLLSALSEDDAKLLSLRYGLEGGRPMQAAQVALQLGMTEEDVINREAAALAKLRQEH